MKDLPLSLETFSTLRENDYLYVDKTRYIFELAKPGKRYFLSRPRRFGKSLLISYIVHNDHETSDNHFLIKFKRNIR